MAQQIVQSHCDDARRVGLFAFYFQGPDGAHYMTLVSEARAITRTLRSGCSLSNR